MRSSFATALCAGFIVVAWPLLVAAQVDEIPTMDQIREAWRARQERFKTVRLEWSAERTLLNQLDDETITNPSPALVADYVRTTIPAMKLSLGSADGQIRFETEFRNSRINGESFPFQTAFDGTTATNYSPPVNEGGEGDEKYGKGTINDQFDDGNYALKPVLLVFRPLARGIHDVDLANYRIQTRVEPLGTRPCVVLQESPGTRWANYATTLYLDIERGFIPLRYQSSVKERITSQASVTYRLDDEYGWLPEAWEASMLSGDGVVSSSTNASVTTSTINEPIDASEFQIAYPARTKVYDKRNGEEYFIAKDGQRQPLAEWGDDPEREIKRGTPATWSRYLLIANAVILVAVVMLVAVGGIRRRRESKSM